MERKKVDLAAFGRMKREGKKITMLTAYDTPTAHILDEAGIDSILVGDSAANVVMGYRDTLPISMDEMIMITSAVARGVKYGFLIGDMPFMSYNVNLDEAVRNAGRFIKEAGADAVKIEGGGHVAETLHTLVLAGIPTVGHLGLTPQTAGMIGGYRVQGRSAEAAARIVEDARRLQEAGACLLVLECVPDRVAALISKTLTIPTIGIGCGAGCDGQVLVLHDMLGIRSGFSPKFVKAYAELGAQITSAVETFRREVEEETFPAVEHAFSIDDGEYEKLLELVE